MIVSAHLITRTRDCAAQGCTLDAEPGLEFCWRCILKPAVLRHEAPEVYTGPTLRCCSCREFKPDGEFGASNKIERRGRHQECRDCSKARRNLARRLMTPEQRAEDRAKQRERRRRSRALMTPAQWEAKRAKQREYDTAKRARLRLELNTVRETYA